MGFLEERRAMKKLGLLCFLFSALLAVPAAAQSAAATRSDLRELQAEVQRLDDSLAAVRDSDPRAREFRRRADAIRDDLNRLKDAVRLESREDRQDLAVSKAEVDEVRQATIELRRDIDRSVGGATGSRDSRDVSSIPDGTEIAIRLDRSVSSKTARPEDRIEASVTEPVRVGGTVAVPAGASVTGIVQAVEAARRPAHGGRLELSFDSMETREGRTVPIRSRVVSLKEDSVDKSKVGLGAVLGGVLGAVLDGGKGALIGVLVGGGGAVVGTKGDEVELPAGTVLTLRLERPVPMARR
jgi:hypothetical protein